MRMTCRSIQLLSIAFFIQTIMLIMIYYKSYIREKNLEINLRKRFDRSSLYDIGMKHHTDKISNHHYETLYEKYLTHYRDTPIRLLEIGLGCTMKDYIGASAFTWREYLGYKADIHYIELDEQCGERWQTTIGKQINVTIHYGNQENITFLQQFKRNMQQFDIIIDDGGHTMNQQKTSFMVLHPLVRSGGLYVIEDLETSYMPSYGGNYWDPSSTISLIKTFVDDIQSESPKKMTHFASKIFSFEVGDGICFFTIK